MACFEVVNGRLQLRGAVTRQPISEWIASRDGAEAIQAFARDIGFSLFGRVRAARRRTYRTLWDAIRQPMVREVLSGECDRYLSAWTELAYAPSLPRLQMDSRRIVVVPRVMIVGRTGAAAAARIAAAMTSADAPDSFKASFARWVLRAMDDAIGRARPAPGRPIRANDSWACIALDRDLDWVDPLWAGPEWRGYVVMFEMPGARLSGRQRRELAAKIDELRRSLPLLTRVQRDHVVRLAADQLTLLTS